MNTAQVLGYPLLIIGAFELFLGFLLLKQNPRNSPVNKATAACAFAAAIWAFSAAFMYISLSLGKDYLFFARFSWVGWFTVPTAIQTVYYLEDEQSRKARIAGLILYPFWGAVLGLCLFTDLIVTDGFMPLPYRNSPGPVELPLRTIGSLSAFWLIGLIVSMRRRMVGYRRSQLSYYLFGTIIFGMGGAVIGGILQVFTGRGLEPSLSAYFSLPWVTMIFYAITRHRLFDIRIVVSRSLSILILSFCVSALQFVLFKMLEPLVGAVATIFISVPVIGVLFFGTPLSRTVQRWINELVLRGRYQYQQMLKESAGAMVTILDLDEVLRFTIETVRKGIDTQEITLYLRGKDGAYTRWHSGIGRSDPAEGSVVPQNVIDYLMDAGQPLLQAELSTGAAGVDPGLMDTVRRMDAELVLPLSAKGELLGVMMLNGRRSGEPYLQGDIDALLTLASHTAAAIENARLFEETVQARASQQESESIFRTLAETTAAAILIVRLDRILYVNKAVARLTGYGREELLTMSPWSIVHPEHRQALYERGRSFVEGVPVPPENEFKFNTKDGDVRWVVAGSAAISFQGEPAILSTMVDITELKRAEEAKIHFYKESAKHYQEKIAEQERFSAILQATSDGFWIVNEENRIVFANEAVSRMFGYTHEELLRMTIADFKAEESPESVRRHAENIRSKGYERFETRHRRKDGSLVDIEVAATRFKEEGTLFAFLRDISERKKIEAEKALLNQEIVRFFEERVAQQERFAAVLSTTRDGFWICDADVHFTFVNDAYCRMLGYTRDELLAMTIKDVERIESAAGVDARTERIARTGYDLFETKHRRKDGSLLDLEITVSSFKDGGTFFSFGRDITDRKKAEAEQARLVAEKEKILKDLHDGIGGITTNINLLAELAQKQDDLSAVRRSLSTIAELSRESLSEIRSFIQSLDARELSWQAVAAEFRSIGSRTIESHGIRFSLGASVPEGGTAPSSSVAMNLFRIYKESLANIVKHAKAKAVDVRFSVEGRRVSLEVRDDGIGLDGKRGTGRGLANMKSRALEMGGDLEVASDNGTRVRLEFPIP